MRTLRVLALITFSAALAVAQTVNCTVLSISGPTPQTNNTCNVGSIEAPISNSANFSGTCNFDNCSQTQTSAAGTNPQTVTASGVCGCMPLSQVPLCLSLGQCYLSNLTPAFGTVYDSYASDGSPLTGHGTGTNWSLLGIGLYGVNLPICNNGTLSNTTEYQCTASSGTCGNNTSQCGADGCDCQYYTGDSCGECGTYACDGDCQDPCSGQGSGDCQDFDDGGFTYLCGGEWCDSNGCDGSGCGCEDDYDPIIISLDGLKYGLTNFQNGVQFDFFNKGVLNQMAWTAKGWYGGFLALDRNGNGKIDNGTELFGNVTPQTPVPGKKPNGFLALAEYDKPENGGNGDGQIDAKDAVYSKLLVWVDKNHNGKSDPGELLTLQEAGVESISLTYSATPWTDAYGNKFRYRANMQMSSGPTSVYDVLLGAGGKPVPVTSGNE